MLWLLLTIAWAAPALGKPVPPQCENLLPVNLNIGIPWIAKTDLRPTDLANEVHGVVAKLYKPIPGDSCSEWRRIHINLALGSDYQMLDWLNRDLLDAAIIPDLSLYLLVRDTIGVYEINPEVVGERLLPWKASTWSAAQRDPDAQDGWRLVPPDLNVIDGQVLYWQILNDAWERASRKETDDCKKKGATDEFRPGNRSPIARQVMFGSHLSSTGFLEPLRRANTFFIGKLNTIPEGDRRRVGDRVWREFFEASHFAVDCDSLQACLKAVADSDQGKDARKLGPRTHMLVFPNEISAPANGPTRYREHFVIRLVAARRVFGVQEANKDFIRVEAKPQDQSERWLSKLLQNPPTPLKSFLLTEPTFGVRTYSFTVAEGLALIRQQQRNVSDRALKPNFALVLPGGGVKAAYQTRVLDELYGEQKSLVNVGAPNPGSALQVQTVIGTSGGALIGYFVAQLNEKRVHLYDVLWGRGKSVLVSKDVFGETDMPRYVSIVVTLTVFCGLLALFPAPKPEERKLATRWRLMLSIWPLFLLAPLLIRLVSKGDDFEHIPDIEGVFYMVMTVVVMAADQCVTVADEPQRPNRSRHVDVLFVSLLFLAYPSIVGAIIGGSSRFDAPVKFIVAFLTLLLFIIGGAVLVAHSQGRLGNPWSRVIDIGSSIILTLVLCRYGLFNKVKLEHIHAAMAIIVVAVFEYVWIRSLPKEPPPPRIRKRRAVLQWIITFLATSLTAALCWPDAPVSIDGFKFLLIESPPVTNGALFFSLGLILLVAGLALWTARIGRYEMGRGQEFLAGLAIITVHSFGVLVLIGILSFLFENIILSLELTPRFWLATLAASLVAGVVVIIAAALNDRYGLPGLHFLRSEHPNGRTIPRRYQRMAAVAIISVLWWNIVQAPALYGNSKARRYHYDAIGRFLKERDSKLTDEQIDKLKKNPPFEPTAHFVAPANLLRADGTRYFMFLSQSGPCPQIAPRPASGAEWLVHRLDGARPGESKCDGSPHQISPGMVAEAAFASGSPFPIFAAHALDIGKGKGTYVDGGYSNNIPVDAARTLDAEQVLIIQSTSPLPPSDDAPVVWWKALLSPVPGKLIQNLQRLPSYLFERSQQMDRLSTLDLFVVSLSPDRDAPEWPLLFDFRKATVNRMGCEASRDLGRRMAIVESWGQPQFRIDVADVRLTNDALASQQARRSPPRAASR